MLNRNGPSRRDRCCEDPSPNQIQLPIELVIDDKHYDQLKKRGLEKRERVIVFTQMTESKASIEQVGLIVGRGTAPHEHGPAWADSVRPGNLLQRRNCHEINYLHFVFRKLVKIRHATTTRFSVAHTVAPANPVLLYDVFNVLQTSFIFRVPALQFLVSPVFQC